MRRAFFLLIMLLFLCFKNGPVLNFPWNFSAFARSKGRHFDLLWILTYFFIPGQYSFKLSDQILIDFNK